MGIEGRESIKQVFVLTDHVKPEIEWSDSVSPDALAEWFFFQESVHTIPVGRPSYIIMPGAKAVFEPFEVSDDACAVVTFGAGVGKISDDGLEMRISFKENDSDVIFPLLDEFVSCYDNETPWFERFLDLTKVKRKCGQLQVECLPGPENISDCDWLALYELVVSPEAEMRLNRARAFKEFKQKNELIVMSDAYKHEMYAMVKG